jgi:hypothetical protein
MIKGKHFSIGVQVPLTNTHKIVTSLLIGGFLLFIIVFSGVNPYTRFNNVGMCFCLAHAISMKNVIYFLSKYMNLLNLGIVLVKELVIFSISSLLSKGYPEMPSGFNIGS